MITFRQKLNSILFPTEEELSVNNNSPYYKNWKDMTYKEKLKTNFTGYRPLREGINKKDVPKSERRREGRRNTLRMSNPYNNLMSGGGF